MKIFKVGGAVRDTLLGLPVSDHDFVVVGASPEEMIAQGFLPVGRDFPVFLHPKTHEEYALARTERKTAQGYAGFAFHASPEVTLEEDLKRRDLTVNAMAQNEDGEIVDPFFGQKDLQNKILRHVSDAFLEDPVRILRVARFSARFSDFSIAPETTQLMQKMVANGEVDALVSERIWQELARGLMEKTPSRMILALRACGALAKVLPEVDALFGVPQRADYHPEIDTGIHVLMALDFSAKKDYALPIRFAVLMHDLGKAKTPPDVLPRHIGHEARGIPLVKAVCERLKVPTACRDLALLVTEHHGGIRQSADFRKETLIKFLKSLDALRRPERFFDILDACACDFHGRLGFEDEPREDPKRLMAAQKALSTLNEGEIAQSVSDPRKIPEAIYKAQLAAIDLYERTY